MSGFTSIKDMFDGGGAGGSGSAYSLKSHDDYKKDDKAKHSSDNPNRMRPIRAGMGFLKKFYIEIPSKG